MKLKFKTLIALGVCSFVALLNQNCGQQSSFSIDDLAANHGPSMLDVDLPESQARIGDRIFVASVLADVFLPNGGEISDEDAKNRAGEASHQLTGFITKNFVKSKDGPIFDIINKFILSNVIEFHGLCSIVDGDSACSAMNDGMRQNATEVQSIAPVSVTRAGYRISACSKLLDNDRAVANMIRNIKGTRQTPMDKRNIIDVYQIFYPAQEIDRAAYDALVKVFESVSGEIEIDRWRAVAIPVCQSSGWQIQ